MQCFIAFSLIAWCLILELTHACHGSSISAVVITNSIIILAMVRSKFFSLETAKNYTNISFSVLPILILYGTPYATAGAQMLTLLNTIIIGIEEYQIHYRIGHFLMAFGTWVLAQQLQLTRESPISSNNSKELESFLINLAMIALIVSIARYYLTKTIEESSSVILQHKTKVQELEAQIKSLKESIEGRDNFIYVFSHEARNPMHVLLANISFLFKDLDSHSPDSKQMKARLTRTKFCAEMLLKNLNNVLDFGKLSTKGGLEITPSEVKVHEYLQSISDFMDILLKKNRLKPELIIPHLLPGILKLDSHRLSQIILNLLTNAAKFTTSGSISLKVSYLDKEDSEEVDFLPNSVFGHLLAAGPEQEQLVELSQITNVSEDPLGFNDYYSQEMRRGFISLEEKHQEMMKPRIQKKGFLKLEINDTGSGMTEEQLQKLFQKFSQPNSENSQTKFGTGLGLWIVKILCELMEGGIRCYSKPGVGSSFVALVRADLVEGEATDSLRQSPIIAPQSGSSRVLLAEGDESELQLNKKHLSSIGLSLVETVKNGNELVERFKAKPEGYYHAILTNTALPGISGIEATTLIREYEIQRNRKQLVKIGFWIAQADPLTQRICQTSPINCWFYAKLPVNLNLFKEIFELAEPTRTNQLQSSNFQRRKSMNKTFRAIQVLCVDDDSFNLDVLDELLTDLGTQVLKASSGEEAISLVSTGKHKIDLIMMDCMMPGMDGWEACRRIKQMLKSEGRNTIPIVCITGDARKNDSRLEEALGMDDVFEKPITREQISMLLNKYARN